MQEDNICGRRKEKSETVQFIILACSHLAQTDYLYRFNQVANNKKL